MPSGLPWQWLLLPPLLLLGLPFLSLLRVPPFLHFLLRGRCDPGLPPWTPRASSFPAVFLMDSPASIPCPASLLNACLCFCCLVDGCLHSREPSSRALPCLCTSCFSRPECFWPINSFSLFLEHQVSSPWGAISGPPFHSFRSVHIPLLFIQQILNMNALMFQALFQVPRVQQKTPS